MMDEFIPAVATTAPPRDKPAQLATGRSILVPLLLACLAAVVPYTRALIAPVVALDDFEILAQSWTWEGTVRGLWMTQNEHAMPLGRLLTFVLDHLAGRPTLLPAVTTRMGTVALLVGMLLVYVFVRRELNHPLYGLLALVLFGVTTVYHQAVVWFAASFSIVALDTMLLALLAAQRWRQTGSRLALVLAALACLLAPGWFAIGVLAGPLCCLYLLAPARGERPFSFARLGAALTPLAGTALFLALSLPHTAQRIMHLEHYDGQTAIEAFRPREGLYTTARSIVDNLLLGVLGFWEVEVHEPYVYILLAAVAALGTWWLYQSPQRPLMILGLGFLFASYLLIYSARANWGYEGVMTVRVWARYHLLPQMGLVLFFCGGLPGRVRWFQLNADGSLTRRQQLAVCALIVVCLLIHLPRGWRCAETAHGYQFEARAAQLADLLRIEEVDARCRQHHISAEDARAALPRFEITWSANVINGWEFLRGSDDPQPLPPDEIRRILEAP